MKSCENKGNNLINKNVMKDLNYYKNNAEENYIQTPISVLRYITELEKQAPKKQFFIYGVIKCFNFLLANKYKLLYTFVEWLLIFTALIAIVKNHRLIGYTLLISSLILVFKRKN